MKPEDLVLDLYNDAIWITDCCKIQREIFSYWTKHNTDPIYQSLAWDVETTGITYGKPSYLHYGSTDIEVHNPTVFGISMAILYKDRIALLWGRHTNDLYFDMLKLLNMRGQKVGHNIKYDLKTCVSNNIKVEGNSDCTMTMARICWNRLKRFALQKLCEFICPAISDWEDEVHRESKKIKSSYTRKGYPKEYSNYSFIDDAIMGPYSMTDSFVCQILNIRLRPIIESTYKKLYLREREAFHNIIESELRGIPFDSRKANTHIRTAKSYGNKLIKKTKSIVNSQMFNPNSPVQVKDALLSFNVLPSQLLNKKGEVSTAVEVLERLIKETKSRKVKQLSKTILDLRSNNKIMGSYLIPLKKRAKQNNGIIYFTINPTDSRTGRMAGKDPNMQNVPRPKSGREEEGNPVRACFCVRYGYIFYFFDYSQMEMAMFGLFANDKRILKAYANGEDIHSYMTIRLYGDNAYDDNGNVIPEKRQKTKGVNFGVIYGMGISGLAEAQKITIKEAGEFHEMYMEEFPSVAVAQEKVKVSLENLGYIEDLFGRRYHIHPNQAYKGVNAYIQGGCAQVVKIAYNKIMKWKKRKERSTTFMLVPIHDEFMFERQKKLLSTESMFVNVTKEKMEIIPQLMEKNFRLRVDVKYSTTNWEEKKLLKVAA